MKYPSAGRMELGLWGGGAKASLAAGDADTSGSLLERNAMYSLPKAGGEKA